MLPLTLKDRIDQGRARRSARAANRAERVLVHGGARGATRPLRVSLLWKILVDRHSYIVCMMGLLSFLALPARGADGLTHPILSIGSNNGSAANTVLGTWT